MHDKDTTGSRVRENCLHGSVERRTQKCDPSTLAYSERLVDVVEYVPEIQGARQLYEQAKSDPEAQELLRILEKNTRDRYSQIAYAKEEGLAEGKAEGLAEGEAKGVVKGLAAGKEEKARETAVNLLFMGLSVEQISKATGLTKEEVTSLKH